MSTHFNYKVVHPYFVDFRDGQMTEHEFVVGKYYDRISVREAALEAYNTMLRTVRAPYKHLVTMQIQRVEIGEWEDV